MNDDETKKPDGRSDNPPTAKQIESRENYVRNRKQAPNLAIQPRCEYFFPEGHKKYPQKCTMVVLTGSKFCRWHISPQDYSRLKNVSLEKIAVKERSKRAGGVGRALVLPKDLAEKYELILADPQLVELKTDIAFVETRIQAVTSRISAEKESRAIIKVLRMIVETAVKEISRGQVSPLTALQDVRILLDKKYSTHLMWEEVYALTEQKRKLVETESKRMKDLNAYLTPDQALGLVTGMVQLAKKYVPSEQMPEFTEDIARLFRLTKQNFSTPVDDAAQALAAYDEIVSSVEASLDAEGVFTVEPEMAGV